uniref:PDZ domain-containing protein n=1 Tax=Anabas testudineus TaxID=64144 RepID=A0A7N6F7Z3_ANATE
NDAPPGYNASSPHVLHMIELEKDPAVAGLGITLTGNKDGSRARMSVYVAEIDPQGPAAVEDGRLKRGDQIIAVNGHCLEGVTHAEAVDILKKTKGTVVLTVTAASKRCSCCSCFTIRTAVHRPAEVNVDMYLC